MSTTNAERLIRTETSQVYGIAQQASIKRAKEKLPDLKKIWWKSGSYICKICLPLHGTERPIDGTWTIRIGNKERKVDGPPGHPRCSCRRIGSRPRWKKALADLGYLAEPPAVTEAA